MTKMKSTARSTIRLTSFCQLTIAAMIKATAIVTTAMMKARIKRMANPTKTRNKTETTQIDLFER